MAKQTKCDSQNIKSEVVPSCIMICMHLKEHITKTRQAVLRYQFIACYSTENRK